MLSYCLKCRKNTENINPRVSKTINGKTKILSKCATCGSKKRKFIKAQEAKGLLSNLGIRKPLIKFQYWEKFCFECNSINEKNEKTAYKNNFILLSKGWRKYKNH